MVATNSKGYRQLCCELFKKRSRSRRDIKARDARRNNMLFIHTLLTLARITQVIFSDGGWLLTELCTTSEQNECIGNYNRALLEPYKN